LGEDVTCQKDCKVDKQLAEAKSVQKWKGNSWV